MMIQSKNLDFANHHPDAVQADIEQLCKEVAQYNFNAAFVNPYWTSFARTALDKARLKLDGNISVGTIVSFPLGQENKSIKARSALLYAEQGADELDVALNVSLIKQAQWTASLDEMKAIVEAVKGKFPHTIIKFIPEVGYLTGAEIQKMAELILESGADFYKTCSGMGPRGAAASDVTLIKAAVGDALKVKVAGGVRTSEQTIQFLEAGAVRIGTSRAIDIITQHSQPSQAISVV